MEEGGFTVHIGIGDIYQKQLDQGKQLSKIEGTLSEMGHILTELGHTQSELGKLTGKLAIMEAQGAGGIHEKRISYLERRMAVMTAFAGLASVLAGGSVAALVTHF